MLPKHSRTGHCDQAHYGTVSGGRETTGIKGGHVVAVEGQLGLGRYKDGGLGGRTERGRGGDVWDGDKNGLN